MSAATRILFVDDEPNLLLTLPTILEQHGFQVTATATVSEALAQIATRQFDALISDLNIGEPGDGFTVVSAMRRTQPGCVNFILTGYPAFETALQAIRSQVDDYLVKPADVAELVRSLEDKLSNPKAVRRVPAQSLAEFLNDHLDDVISRTLESMKTHARLGRLPLSDHQRVGHIPAVVSLIVQQLRSGTPDDPTAEFFRAGIEHGESRRQQGYSQDMLVDDTRLLDSALYATVQDHMLRIKLSNLIQDLSRLNDVLEAHLQASLIAFHSKKTA